ncbi:recombinase family protein [Amycolatopsis sp. 195334CR]|nr:recombinase family protein [Amycolatopsis sp. 195334CR]
MDDQLAENDAWVEREPTWTMIFVRRDDGISASKYAKKKKRPDWELVMASIEAGEIDILLIWELSRASRDRMVFAALFAACEENDVKIGIGGRVYDLANEEDAFLLDLLAALAVRESGLTAKRIRRSTRSGLASGRPHGKAPFGYAREYDPTTGKMVRQIEDPDNGPIVREMARRVLAGEPLNAIAVDLNARGIFTKPTKKHPEGAPWSLVSVRRTVMNPTYVGKRVHHGKIVDGPAEWPPILDEDEHAQVVARLSDPGRKTWVDGGVKHLLVGIGLCGKVITDEDGTERMCGAKVRLINNRGTPSYACSRKFCVARTKWLVDEFVTDVVIGRLERPDAAELLAQPEDKSEVEELRQKAAGLRARLAGFVDAAAEGEVSPVALAKIEAKLLPQIEEADRRVQALVAAHSPLVAELVGDQARARWEALTIPQQREVIRALGAPIIWPTGRGRWRDPNALGFWWHGTEAPVAPS